MTKDRAAERQDLLLLLAPASPNRAYWPVP
jgi:hypothetical protein